MAEAQTATETSTQLRRKITTFGCAGGTGYGSALHCHAPHIGHAASDDPGVRAGPLEPWSRHGALGNVRAFQRRLWLRAAPARAGAPWIVATGWLPRTYPNEGFIREWVGDVEVYLAPRIARYTQAYDLVIWGAGIWRWRWLVVADPYALDHMRDWKHALPEGLPPGFELREALSGHGMRRQ